VCVCVCAAEVMKNLTLSKARKALQYNNAGDLRAAIDEYQNFATVEDNREIQAAQEILHSIDERRGGLVVWLSFNLNLL